MNIKNFIIEVAISFTTVIAVTVLGMISLKMVDLYYSRKK